MISVGTQVPGKEDASLLRCSQVSHRKSVSVRITLSLLG